MVYLPIDFNLKRRAIAMDSSAESAALASLQHPKEGLQRS